MPAVISTSRWRDQGIVPKDYKDVASLVEIARKARHRIVEFDWAFTQDDLRRLRRGVYEWGTEVQGRYKCFDARVLAAINDALGETNSIFVLSEPRSTATDCQVSCIADGDVFRLRGHATFDIIFGYGYAGAGQNSTGSAHLGPTVEETLADAVGMLGWDLHLLQRDEFRPVRNALYGLPLGYGAADLVPAGGPPIEVSVHFRGPFSALSDGALPCLFTDEIAKEKGVYLWTINVNGQERPWYVGQTRRGFGQRLAEHLAAYLSGQYPTNDAAALSRGDTGRAVGAVEGVWPHTLPSFLQNCEGLIPNIIALIRLIRFNAAPLVGDKHLYDRVEGAIGRYYKTHPDPELLKFFTPGIKLPSAIPGDRPIHLTLSSETPLAGLPTEIREE